MLNEEFEDPVVMDIGSLFSKMGVAGEDAPRFHFPTVVGRLKYSIDNYEIVGEDFSRKRGIWIKSYPIEHGMITNWEDIEKVWHHSFYYEVRADPEEHPILLTEPPFNPKQNREKTTQIMFETFNLQRFYLSLQASLALLSSARTTGLVLDSGGTVTHAVPIYEGQALQSTAKMVNFGGRELTEYLAKLLRIDGVDHGLYNQILGCDIKEKYCFVSPSFNMEQKKGKKPSEENLSYELPDGSLINLDSRHLECPEALFKPEVFGKEEIGMHKILFQTISESDKDIQKELFGNIVLSGGNTMFKGFPERLKSEVDNVAPQNTSVNVIGRDDRNFSAWIGGSILAKLSSFKSKWITKNQYDEHGPAIVHRKCF